MQLLFPVLIIVIVLVAIGLFLRHSFLAVAKKDQDNKFLMLVQSQIDQTASHAAQQIDGLQAHLREEMQQMQQQIAKALADANRTVGDRWDNTARVLGDVRQSLGQVDEASKHIFDVGKEIAELQQTLQAPKLRGSIGEYMLTELLSQVLPEQSFATQYQFKNGEVVDAVIKLRMGMVAIDAKFPLANFKRFINAIADEDRKAASKMFVRNVKGHIDDIADKYIRRDEGTFDFAMMYIPAENVYYEIMLKNDSFAQDSLFNYALRRHVIPVSPNSFYAYLQTILLGLKGMRVEESARGLSVGTH